MSIVAERPVVRAVGRGLAEEIERQEREDNARGPEPEQFVLSRGRWVRAATVPSLLPSGFVAAAVVGTVVAVEADELRARRLMIAAQARFGWGRSL